MEEKQRKHKGVLYKIAVMHWMKGVNVMNARIMLMMIICLVLFRKRKTKGDWKCNNNTRLFSLDLFSFSRIPVLQDDMFAFHCLFHSFSWLCSMQSKEYIGIKEIMWVGASLEKTRKSNAHSRFLLCYTFSLSLVKGTRCYISAFTSQHKKVKWRVLSLHLLMKLELRVLLLF